MPERNVNIEIAAVEPRPVRVFETEVKTSYEYAPESRWDAATLKPVAIPESEFVWREDSYTERFTAVYQDGYLQLGYDGRTSMWNKSDVEAVIKVLELARDSGVFEEKESALPNVYQAATVQLDMPTE